MYMANYGTGRLPIGDTLFAGGGSSTTTIYTQNLPPYTPSGSVASSFSGSVRVVGVATSGTGTGGAYQAGPYAFNAATFTVDGGVSSTFSGNAQGGTSTPILTYSPALVAGVVMIRAA
jgi:hypothetical protein